MPKVNASQRQREMRIQTNAKNECKTTLKLVPDQGQINNVKKPK